jgi:hypothetical protein
MDLSQDLETVTMYINSYCTQLSKNKYSIYTGQDLEFSVNPDNPLHFMLEAKLTNKDGNLITSSVEELLDGEEAVSHLNRFAPNEQQVHDHFKNITKNSMSSFWLKNRRWENKENLLNNLQESITAEELSKQFYNDPVHRELWLEVIVSVILRNTKAQQKIAQDLLKKVNV